MKTEHSIVMKVVRSVTAVFILLPLALIVVWSAVKRWPWPDLLPTGFSARGFDELFGTHSQAMPVLASSMVLSVVVAVLATLIGLMTARAVTFYDFPGKKIILFSSILPIIVPGTVFAMGIHVFFIRMGLSDSVTGVIIAHIICALPYTINVLADVTEAVGDRLEVQAQSLGASPLQAFFLVTLPLLKPGILSSISMAYIISSSQYFLTLLLGGGKVKTLSIVMLPFISGGDRTLAGAYAVLFVASSLAVFTVFELAGRD